MPIISVFIPAYKNIQYLQRLLDSITIQKFRDFEVIISDDSPTDEVQNLVQKYLGMGSHWKYYRNQPPLGMPQNWNYALHQCSGEWIKIMHDDDWFADENSLSIFADHASHTEKKFLFSAYYNVNNVGKSAGQLVSIGKLRKKALRKEPLTLLSDNVIGPPTVTLVHKSIAVQYDIRLRWRVDIDYYIQILQKIHDFEYIAQPLVNIGISANQVTQEVKNNKSVEIPEAYHLLQKYGTDSFKNILVYDSWWRFFRNMHVFDQQELQIYLPNDQWPIRVIALLKDLHRCKKIVVKNGALSKLCMIVSYLKMRIL